MPTRNETQTVSIMQKTFRNMHHSATKRPFTITGNLGTTRNRGMLILSSLMGLMLSFACSQQPDKSDPKDMHPCEYRLATQNSHSFSPSKLVLTTNATPHPIVIKTLDGQYQPINFPYPVSIAPIDQQHCLICNYTDIALINLPDHTATLLTPPPDIPKWNPTGLCYRQDARRLYVANYLGHNILIFEFHKDNSLHWVREIKHEQMHSPEGIAVTKDGTRIAAADNDGHAVLMFDTDGNLRWKAPLRGAHGVAFTPDQQHLLASGLESRTLAKYDLTGTLVAENGSLGWAQDQYLWPTAMAVSSEKVIALTDAHTGQISFVTQHLAEYACIGGNGPDTTLFNMPYGLAWLDENTLLVADTLKHRLLRVNPYENRIDTIDHLRPRAITPPVHATSHTQPANPKRDTSEIHPRLSLPFKRTDRIITEAPPATAQYDGYTNRAHTIYLKLPRLGNDIPEQWYPAYDKFVAPNGRLAHTTWISNVLSNYSYYFTFGMNTNDNGKTYTLLGSPQARVVLVVCDGLAAPVRLPTESWLLKNELVGDGVVIALRDVVTAGARALDQFKSDIQNGIHPIEATRTLLNPALWHTKHPVSQDDFLYRLAITFQTRQGKEFAKHCHPAATAQELRQAAQTYFDARSRKSNISLPEYFLVSLLSYTPDE